MFLNKMTIEDTPIKGKRLFIRADFNVPLDRDLNITDDSRIRSTLRTINYAIDEGASVILASHLGRPKGADLRFSLAPIAKRLQRRLGKEVKFAPDCIGPEAKKMAERLKPGDVLLLENLRFHPGEEKNDDTFSEALAGLGIDVYINDAFGTAHRDHASTTGITKFVKVKACGLLMKKEITYLEGAVANPARPFVAILGGTKVSGKIGVIENLGKKVDKVIIGGGMAFTFLKATGIDVGNSPVEDAMIPIAREIRKNAIARGIKFYLPVDCVAAPNKDPSAEAKNVPIQEIPQGWLGLDIGPASVRLFMEVLANAKTILWNGPMGLFEMDAYSRGTSAVAQAVANAYALTIVGGGETAMAVHQAGESESISFISTGGGAALQLLEGEKLPGLSVLPDKPF
ncbi:MAG: phosphoglycerate kinase [Nitrospira sp.]|nr:phosphoglycerate kinase [Candidatus Manganitrophaceae bacterium]HIL34131.1 phosphoglycerate kinase [Candidatus Manganitrophaceae bacterium]